MQKQKIVLTTLGVAGVGIVASAVLSGCSQKAREPFRDAGVTGHDSGKALIIEMPDGFNNLATKCVNGVRYTVVFHGDHGYGAVTTLAGPGNGC